MSHVHIAHDPKDLDALLQVHESLRKAGVPDWYDPDPAGSARAIVDAKLSEAFAVLVLVSQDAMKSRAVKADMDRARARGVPLVPYRLDKARLSGPFRTALSPYDVVHADEPDSLARLVELVKSQYKRRCPVVAVMNMKGGVGKTTIASQVFGAYQADRANRVLLVDLDPQYNLTQAFFDMETADTSAEADRSVISLFEKSRLHATDAASPGEAWRTLNPEPFTPAPRDRLVHPVLSDDGPPGGLDVVSGQFEISKYAFAGDPEALGEIRSNFLRALDHYRADYDLIVFDTNPNATFLTGCALAAADRIVAPMHADAYSLRGVRLLNQVMETHAAPEARPALSVLFNAVRRSEQSNFEADVRVGAHDELAGFALSNAVLENAVPQSGHLAVKAPDQDAPAWTRLVAHHGRGGGLRRLREALSNVANEIERVTAG